MRLGQIQVSVSSWQNSLHSVTQSGFALGKTQFSQAVEIASDNYISSSYTINPPPTSNHNKKIKTIYAFKKSPFHSDLFFNMFENAFASYRQYLHDVFTQKLKERKKEK